MVSEVRVLTLTGAHDTGGAPVSHDLRGEVLENECSCSYDSVLADHNAMNDGTPEPDCGTAPNFHAAPQRGTRADA
jgi:hypothetical protein